MSNNAGNQLSITLYRLVHGGFFSTARDLFGVSESLANKMFNHVVHLLYHLVRCLCETATDLGRMEVELRRFIENYEFPCVGTWDGFHVYVSFKLKQFCNFKKSYTMTNLALVGNNFFWIKSITLFFWSKILLINLTVRRFCWSQCLQVSRETAFLIN